ncbi:MAG: glycosyltransferase family 61 protein [Frankiaceae bacterium]|nr:glycosyltransferase family 61 protein [Frankiaceae bacterium]
MVIVTSSGEVIRESVRKPAILARHPALAALSEPAGTIDATVPLNYRTFEGGAGFVLGASQHMNYYHWMIETVPRFAWARDAGARIMLLASPQREFHLQSRQFLFDWDPQPVALREAYYFPEILFVEPLAPTNVRLSPSIRDFYWSTRVTSSGEGIRLLVSRADARTRRLHDERALLDALAPLGFQLFSAAGHTVEEQAKAFARAEAVIGVHGAGLANLAFCRPGTCVLEILPSSFHEGITSYGALAELLELRYAMYIGNAVQPNQRANSDVAVSISDVVAATERLLSRV